MNKDLFVFAPVVQKRHSKPIPTSSYLKVMLAMMLVTLIWQFWTASFWRVQSVEIAGNATYSKAYLENYLKSASLEGQHLIQINPLQIRTRLLNNALLKDLQVERQLFPARIILRVQERIPAFRLLHANAGSVYHKKASTLVDIEGHVLHIPLTVSATEPLQVAIEPVKLEAGKLAEAHLDALYQLNQYHQTDKSLLEGVYNISDPNNIILKTKGLDVPIWLGLPLDIPRKLHLLKPILKLSDKEKYQIQYVDLRFWKHPVIKKSDS